MVSALGSGFFYEKSEKKRAGACRELFGNKVLEDFQISSIEDRAVSSSVIVVTAKWNANQKHFTERLTFGCIYCDNNYNPLIGEQTGGRWILNGWDIRALY